jgi:hypothetical protein
MQSGTEPDRVGQLFKRFPKALALEKIGTGSVDERFFFAMDTV